MNSLDSAFDSYSSSHFKGAAISNALAGEAYDAFAAGFQACAAEAERLCRENAETGQPQCNRNCHLMDGNDIRAKLAEVEK